MDSISISTNSGVNNDSSRIIIKSIPPSASEASVLAHLQSFSSDVTDLKIARTRSGVSRCFCFVGFKSPEIAQACVKALNKTFLGSSRLTVELAREIGDDAPTLQRAQSKYTKAKLAARTEINKDIEPSKDSKSLQSVPSSEVVGLSQRAKNLVNEKSRDLLSEYLALSKSRANAPTWADDDAMGRGSAPDGKLKASSKLKKEKEENTRKGSNSDSDDDEYEEIPSLASKKLATDDFPNTSEQDNLDKPQQQLNDLDYLRSKVKSNFDDEDDDLDVEAAEKGSKKRKMVSFTSGDQNKAFEKVDRKRPRSSREVTGNEPMVPEEQISSSSSFAGANDALSNPLEENEEVDLAETGRLFVRNLPFSCSEDNLKGYFSKFGPIADVSIPVDFLGKPKGFGYVLFVVPEHAVEALSRADGKSFQGRILHIMPAAPAPVSKASLSEGAGDRSSGFKGKKEAERRKGAGSELEVSRVWNSLFVRAGTALAATAEQLGVSKDQVLDRDSGSSMAVRMAFAETQVIADTKAFLEKEGVSVSALEQALVDRVRATQEARESNKEAIESGAKSKKQAATTALSYELPNRSDTVILVKNLPFTAESSALREIFSRHGQLLRLVMPPSRALALVEFGDAKAAKKAFSALAYSRFQREPLYLEWAPESVFTSASLPVALESAPLSQSSKSGAWEDPAAASSLPSEANNTQVPSSTGHTVFVKNLSFATTEDAFKLMMSKAGPLRTVRIPKRRNPKFREGEKGGGEEFQSLGYGFAEFATKEGADTAMRKLQGQELDGHALQLSISVPKVTETAPKLPPKPQSSTKDKGVPVASAAAAVSKEGSLIVRNLAFESTKKELMELFSAFGTVRSLRLPKKFDGSHRGFAFVDFLTNAEAKEAMRALSATHLYGRKLVLEWAELTTPN